LLSTSRLTESGYRDGQDYVPNHEDNINYSYSKTLEKGGGINVLRLFGRML
jgi:hypothetical protein